MIPTYLRLKYNNKVEYHIRIASRVTIICGDSATGKTVMLEALCDQSDSQHDDRVIEYRYTAGVPAITTLKTYPEGSIVFMDEDTVKYLWKTDQLHTILDAHNYYVLITRLQAVDIPCSISDIYELQTVDGITKAVRRYPNFDKWYDANEYVCEDEVSGYMYWDNYLPNVTTMRGRLNWKKYKHCECLIMDAAALGSEIADMLHENVKLYAPQSFEYLLIKYFTELSTEDLVGLLEPTHKTYERLFTDLCANRRCLGFKYSKRNCPPVVLMSRIIPELSQYKNKLLEGVKSQVYLSTPVTSKAECKDALRKVLMDIGATDAYTDVYVVLPETLEADSFVDTVINILKSRH